MADQVVKQGVSIIYCCVMTDSNTQCVKITILLMSMSLCISQVSWCQLRFDGLG